MSNKPSNPFITKDQWKMHAQALQAENGRILRENMSLRAEVERLRAGIQRVVTECKVACSGACMSDPAWNAYDDCKDMLEALLK